MALQWWLGDIDSLHAVGNLTGAGGNSTNPSIPIIADCHLLGGAFSYMIQLACGFLAIGSLVVKRATEAPQRPWNIWLMDVAKQVTSGAAAHFAGLNNAHLLHRLSDSGNECSWYLISFTIDTSLGVYLSFLMLRLCTHIAKQEGGAGPCCWNPRRSLPRMGDLYPSLMDDGTTNKRMRFPSLVKSGYYGPKDSPQQEQTRVWLKQMLVWVVICVLARACCGLVMYFSTTWFPNALPSIANAIKKPFIGYPDTMLAVVMLGGPVCGNIIQYWVQDTILAPKSSKLQHSNTPAPTTDEDQMKKYRAQRKKEKLNTSADLRTSFLL